MSRATWVVLIGAALAIGAAVLVRQELAQRSGEEARRLVAAGATLVDVRTPQEYAAGHIEAAVNVPLHALRERAAELGSPAAPVVVYCRSGARSAQAAGVLEAAGFSAVHDLGPMSAWGTR